MVGGFYTEDGPHWVSSFMDLWWVGHRTKYAVRWGTSYKILAVSVQTRVELPCFIVHLEFFLIAKAVYKRFDWAGCVRGTKVNHLTKCEWFPNDHSRSRVRFSFAKVAVDSKESASSALHGVSVFGFLFQWGFLWVQKQVPILFQAQLKLRFLTSQGGKILWFFRAQKWLSQGLKSVLTLAAEVQGVLLKGELLYVLDSTSGHHLIFSWLHQKTIFFVWERGRCVSHLPRLELREPIGKNASISSAKNADEVALVTWHTLVQRNRHQTNHQWFNDCFLVKEEKQHCSTAHVLLFLQDIWHTTCARRPWELLGTSFEWLDGFQGPKSRSWWWKDRRGETHRKRTSTIKSPAACFDEKKSLLASWTQQ